MVTHATKLVMFSPSSHLVDALCDEVNREGCFKCLLVLKR